MADRRMSVKDSRVLILAPNWLGDVVMTTPLLTYLHETFPDLDLVLGVRRRWAALFRDDPRISELILIERSGRHKGIRGLVRQAAGLRQEKFDGVVICPPSFRAALVCRLAGIPLRIGYQSDGRSALLSQSLPSNPRGRKHYCQEMLELGTCLSYALDSPASATQTRMPDPTLPGCHGVAAVVAGEGPPIWVYAPGTTYGEAKTWPVEPASEFLRLAVHEHGVRVVLLGDVGATGIAKRLRQANGLPWRSEMPGPASVIDLTGQTNLLDAVGILRRAEAFVGNDSGLMHLAAALGLATVGVFGSSSTDWTAPRGTLTDVVIADGFSCQPCFRKTCNQDLFCLETVAGTGVYRTLTELLQTVPNGGAQL